MGVATFIENDFGTQTSKALVYNAWWFELIMAFFIINFFGNIFRYKLLRKEKWAVLMFHLSFLFILIGAGVTRYIGYEGIMLISEGETTSEFLSETTYLNVTVDDGENQRTPNIEKSLLLSAWGENNVEFESNFKTQKINFKLVEYIPWAEKKLIEDENGVEHLFFVESSEGTRHEHWIKKGTIQNIHGILVGFDASSSNASINFTTEEGSLKMSSKDTGDWFRMADQKRGNIVKDSVQNFQYLTLHNVSGLQFSIMSPEEIRKNSVVEITKHETYDKDVPVIKGLFDNRMGTTDMGKVCATCGLDNIGCPGHFGHIELPKPVFNLQFETDIVKILRCICIKCSKLRKCNSQHNNWLL